MGFEAGFEVQGGGPRGWTEEKEKKEKEKEKFLLCESVGHRPLRGRCPKSLKIYIPDTCFLCHYPSAHENFVALHFLFDTAIHFFNKLMGGITDKLNDELVEKLVN